MQKTMNVIKSTTWWVVQPTNPLNDPVELKVTFFNDGNVGARSAKHGIEVYAKDLDALDIKIRSIVTRIFGGKNAKQRKH